MNSNVQKKIRAITMRMQGYSYNDIVKEVSVPKGTLAGWLKHIQLTKEQESALFENIKQKQSSARAKAVASNRTRRLHRDTLIYEQAEEGFKKFQGDRDFIVGTTLYWAEGTKKDVTFSFINSDPTMTAFMYRWMLKYLGVDKKAIKIRLFIHEPYKEEGLESFWAGLLGHDRELFQKTIYKPTPHTIKKNPEYKGCLRMYVNGVHHYRTVMRWKELLATSLDM